MSDPGNGVLKKILRTSIRTPRILWWQTNEILFKLQKQRRSVADKHPCVNTWLKLVRCMRRFPHNMVKRCSGEASRHYQCTLANQDWSLQEDVSYLRILEEFNLLDKKKEPEPPQLDTGYVNRF